MESKNVANLFIRLILRDKNITLDLIQRAENTGYQGLIITVDTPIMGKRERDIRNGFSLATDLSAANIKHKYLNTVLINEKQSLIKIFTDNLINNALNWDDVQYIKSKTKLPVILKGITRPVDALKAYNYGMDAIIVSNHGGRQVDGVPSTMELLCGIKKQLQNKIPILLDGGIRRGTDILKAIALGADCTLIARPVLWGLALNGKSGVDQVLQMLYAEFYEAMLLCGYSSVAEIKADPELICWDYLQQSVAM